ncbi:MAG: YbaK/EbsC family protein [Alteromonadales bacterium]|nr:YbaK/EbsC family protein [Alteromonadales bacterium]
MTIASKVNDFLDNSDIHYQLIHHNPSSNSIDSALKSNVTTSQVVKAVMLEDLFGHKLMAILPTSHKLNLRALNKNFKRQFHIMKESHIYELFQDCKQGAIPPIAQAYGIERVYDKFLLQQAVLYLEAGDHTSLIRLSQHEFRKLMANTMALNFSHQIYH